MPATPDFSNLDFSQLGEVFNEFSKSVETMARHYRMHTVFQAAIEGRLPDVQQYFRESSDDDSMTVFHSCKMIMDVLTRGEQHD
jgi:hypothetical protein